MSEQVEQPVVEPVEDPAPVVEPVGKPSLEDSLSALDQETRDFILGEVTSARNEAKKLRQRVKEAEPKLTEYDRLVEAGKSELERAQEQATANAALASSLLDRAVKAEIKAAAGTFASPEDAFTFLADTDKYVTNDGDIDSEAIQADLADLLKAKPYLAAVTTPPRRGPVPDPSQGSSALSAQAGQLSKADIERLAAEGKHSEIDKALKEGRLSVVLSGK